MAAMEWKEILPLLRKERGLTQEELATALGISRQAVSKWEKGQAVPSADNLLALSRVYEMTVEELYQKRDEQSREIEKTEESTQAEQSNKKQSHGKTWMIIFSAFIAGACLVLIVLGKILHAEATTKIFLIFVVFLVLLGWIIIGIIKIIYELRKGRINNGGTKR